MLRCHLSIQMFGFYHFTLCSVDFQENRPFFFKDGKEIDRKVGVMPAGAYTQVLDANL